MNNAVRPASAAPAAPEGQGLREVHRAASELRRGAAVALRAAGQCLLVLAAETVETGGLAEFMRLARGDALVVLARRRAAAALAQAPDAPVDLARLSEFGTELAAYAPYPGRLHVSLLRGLADPTEAQSAPGILRSLLSDAPLPFGAQAAVALAKLARLLPAVLVAAVDPAATAGLLAVDDADVLAYPTDLTVGLRQVASADVPLDSAPDARVVAFRPLDGGIEHLAIIVGHPERMDAPLVRIHSACLTGDLLGSLRCDCGPQLRAALARMTQEGAGILLYLAQEGRGIGLVNKLRAYAIQDRGQDTVDANLSLGWAVDERSFLAASIMLEQLGVRRVRLLTNNPAKLAALTACGIEVAGREAHIMAPNGVNDAYLQVKSDRLGHLLS